MSKQKQTFLLWAIILLVAIMACSGDWGGENETACFETQGNELVRVNCPSNQQNDNVTVITGD